MKKISLIIASLVMASSFSYCYGETTISEWTEIFQGVTHATGWTDTPRLQRVTAVKIDLNDPDISFDTTQSNGTLPGEVSRQTGSTFLVDSQVQIAINGQFTDVNAGLSWPNLAKKTIALYESTIS